MFVNIHMSTCLKQNCMSTCKSLRILHVDINKYVNMQKGTTCKNVTTCYMYSMNVDM